MTLRRNQSNRARPSPRHAPWLPLALVAAAVLGSAPGRATNTTNIDAPVAIERPATTGAACQSVVQAPGVGPACQTPDGMLHVTSPDGYSFSTHGSDMADYVYSAFQAPIRPRPVSCATNDNQFRVELFYAHAAGTTSRYSAMKAEINKMLEAANGLVYDEGRRFGRSLSLRVLCASGKPYIRPLTLPTSKTATHLGTVIKDMRTLGYTNPLAKYWVWFDKTIKVGNAQVGGTGTVVLDDRLTAMNGNMLGAGYAAVWGHRLNSGAHVTMLHEGFHNFGGVPISAPHTTGAAHCTDGVDVMCYNDGGPTARFYTITKCRDRVALDCRNDDYFNPAPKSSTYLATHWNLASPYNRFIRGCAFLEGNLRAPAAGQDPEAALPKEVPPQGLIARSARISTSCAGRTFAITGVVQQPPQQVHSAQGATGNVPGDASLLAWGAAGAQEPTDNIGERVVPDLDVCFYKGTKLLKCVTGATDRGTIPTGTDTVRVILATGANVNYVFSAL